MDTPTPPREFVSALRAFDSTLRIRWAHRTQVWLIERKMEPQHKQLLAERQNPFGSPKGLDLYDGWKDGYLHVVSVHPDLLDHEVFAVLAEHDLWRQGGREKFAQKLEDIEAADEKQLDRDRHNYHEAAAKEAYERLAWAQGRRVSLHEPAPKIEPKDGFVVHDRRNTRDA